MRPGPLVLAALLLTVPAATVHAASTQRVLLDWTEGTFVAGLGGNGDALWPEGVPAPDHERIDFAVDPCHRKLSPGLLYEPAGAFVDAEAEGIHVMAGIPFRFQLSLLAPNGTVLQNVTIDEPDPSIGGPNIPFYKVQEPGTYTILLELLEGAAVDWQLRVRGFAVSDEPTCDLWLNEVELNPAGPDAGEEWVELFNEGEAPLDVSGWTIEGQANGSSFTIPEGTTVPAGGYAVVDLTGDAPLLANGNETVALVAPTGGTLDASPALKDLEDDARTWQRSPDSASSWTFATGTPGASNVA